MLCNWELLNEFQVTKPKQKNKNKNISFNKEFKEFLKGKKNQLSELKESKQK